jgi:hypothetical protein
MIDLGRVDLASRAIPIGVDVFVSHDLHADEGFSALQIPQVSLAF